MLKSLAVSVVVVAAFAGVAQADLIWDFEGSVVVEGDPMQDRLYDQSGIVKFNLVTDDGGDTFDRFTDGVPSNPVRYGNINDESPISSTPGGGDNIWLIRSDWGTSDGTSHAKHADGPQGAFVSGTFFIGIHSAWDIRWPITISTGRSTSM